MSGLLLSAPLVMRFPLSAMRIVHASYDIDVRIYSVCTVKSSVPGNLISDLEFQIIRIAGFTCASVSQASEIIEFPQSFYEVADEVVQNVLYKRNRQVELPLPPLFSGNIGMPVVRRRCQPRV